MTNLFKGIATWCKDGRILLAMAGVMLLSGISHLPVPNIFDFTNYSVIDDVRISKVLKGPSWSTTITPELKVVVNHDDPENKNVRVYLQDGDQQEIFHCAPTEQDIKILSCAFDSELMGDTIRTNVLKLTYRIADRSGR